MLDTHIWLWCSLNSERVSPELLAKMIDTKNELWLSPVTVLEQTCQSHFAKPYGFIVSGVAMSPAFMLYSEKF